MRAPRYPLEPLVKLREEQVDAAVRGLASAVAAREAAERERQAAEARRAAHTEAATGVRAAEAEALARGVLSAGDLARAGAWELRVASEATAIGTAVERASATATRALQGEDEARGEVAARQASAEVVVADQTRWRDALRKKTEAREEEAAEEAFRPKR